MHAITTGTVAILIFITFLFISEWRLKVSKNLIFKEVTRIAYSIIRYTDVKQITPEIYLIAAELQNRMVKVGNFSVTEKDREVAMTIAKYISIFGNQRVRDPVILLHVIARRLNEFDGISAKSLVSTNGRLELVIGRDDATDYDRVIYRFNSPQTLF
ncbi:hypothetical protein RAY_143 [Erwinia phage vB_EamM_RAY]|uniref:Uncharacterized protein n=10 Tax=Agricanvirus TaxID=1984776 RepID=A0A173GDZ2_9CAUD|nr:hypothetical protein Ea357_142 [Erwinia phage Ea35-70]YP_009605291.1 hypothetical protein FDH97_gp148 [Erwinia phage vB_EamM_Deimos-Minion]YP_009605610.1 hypothetical protein FDH98_gp143 [Erwinia phage vB_EamM_RAY]YP_009605930.1 hypothetical protein FDH99_gp146 [Erwinia phage vB_EamM_Simmy50]YP_009606251.1 hypothetical protein FDI00_gp145 [Erwinia phage vB_EamM_Special G]YP_009621884.1 hypothetical protein FDJ23_gp143 [Erwinia phage vB_EamM_Desertfox]AUG85931.1 hypothetical protein BOSOLAP